MGAFISGVLASLLASVLLLRLSPLISARLGEVLTWLLGRATGLRIEANFPTQSAASKRLFLELRRSKTVRVYGGRGNEFVRRTFRPLWDSSNAKLGVVQVLLPNPDGGPGSWLEDRESELARFDRTYGRGLLAQQIRSNVRYLEEIDDSRVEMRLFDFPHLGRIVLTDRVAFVTPYEASAHGDDSPCFVFASDSAMYGFAERIFSKAWASAQTSSKGED